MIALLARLPGVGMLIELPKYFRIRMPRSTTALGGLLLAGIAAIRLFWLAGHLPGTDPPLYYQIYLALVGLAAVVAVSAMVVPRPAVAAAGWTLGSIVSLVTLGMYLASRIAGLPGLAALVDLFAYPIGTLAMVLSAAYLAWHVSVLMQINVALPHTRSWHD